MAAVHVRVGHADDAVVAELIQMKILADAAAERGNHGFDFRVGENLVQARFFHVEDFAAQRQNRLKMAVASALGGAAGAVALDEENFAFGGVALRAVRQLSRAGLRFPGRFCGA